MLSGYFKTGKTVAFLEVDNGSDWNLHFIINSIYLCRLWKDSGSDILGVLNYAAKYSAYNNIQHLWAPLSKKPSVILPSVLEEDDEEPCQQSGLSPSEVYQKE